MDKLTLNRRTLLKSAPVAAFACTILNFPASAAEFKLRLGNNQVADYPLNVRMREASARIRERTSGRVELQLFPAGQLGTDTDMLSQTRSGALQFYTASGLVLSTLVPISSINALGFIFSSYDQVWPAMDGALGGVIRSHIEKIGLLPFEKIFDIGFRQITSNAFPIQTPDNLQGFKIRIPPSKLGVSLFKSLGASPATLNWAETYTALQTKVVDGQENPLSIIDTGKFYEVQKYCSLTNHMWDGFWLLGNAAAFKRLPKDVQDILAEEFARAAVEDRADIQKLESSMKGVLESKGVKVSAADQATFRSALQKAGFYKEWRGNFGDDAWKVLEKYTGELG